MRPPMTALATKRPLSLLMVVSEYRGTAGGSSTVLIWLSPMTMLIRPIARPANIRLTAMRTEFGIGGFTGAGAL